jgi:hypothetical protein
MASSTDTTCKQDGRRKTVRRFSGAQPPSGWKSPLRCTIPVPERKGGCHFRLGDCSGRAGCPIRFLPPPFGWPPNQADGPQGAKTFQTFA